MKLFRNCTIGDLFGLFKTGTILPKLHPGSVDSTLPVGEFSFWFNKPILFPFTAGVVVGEFQPEVKGKMTITWDDPWNDFDYRTGKLDEFGTSQPIAPTFIAVDWYQPIVPEKAESEMSINELARWRRAVREREHKLWLLCHTLGNPPEWKEFLVWMASQPQFCFSNELDALSGLTWKRAQEVAEVVPNEEDDD